MALPFGTYNDDVIKVLKEVGVLYCRTCEHTYNFEMPNDLPLLHPTCHFRYKDLDKLTDEFLNTQTDGDMLFYIWGHSYELVTEDDWQNFELMLKIFLTIREKFMFYGKKNWGKRGKIIKLFCLWN